MTALSATPALAAALLFGASTPVAKLLVGEMPPLLLAGLLYLGSGLGLCALLSWRRARGKTASATPPLAPGDLPWLLGGIVSGGIAGPALLMTGLALVPAATASLLLNVEGVMTALLAWLVFGENAGRRVVAGMAAIVAGGVLLSWQPGAATAPSEGALLVIAACLAWAVDNNMTRRVSANDAMLVAGLKGLVAGAANTLLAVLSGAAMPAPAVIGAAMLVGLMGYGLSLTLFVVALRALGTARTGAYFSVAPLVGVIVSLLLWPERPGASFWLAAALMAWGVWLHLGERHEHEHTHEPLEHRHPHRHDEHHRHAHDATWNGDEPHSHWHRHEATTHKHPHYPDIHHRHDHAG